MITDIKVLSYDHSNAVIYNVDNSWHLCIIFLYSFYVFWSTRIRSIICIFNFDDKEKSFTKNGLHLKHFEELLVKVLNVKVDTKLSIC